MDRIPKTTFFQQAQCDNAAEFLRHVMLGHDTEVIKILENNPELATTITYATDPSGRSMQVSGLIYAAWALDITMLRSLAPFLQHDLETYMSSLVLDYVLPQVTYILQTNQAYN